MTEAENEEINSLEEKVEDLKNELEEVTRQRDDLQQCVNDVYDSVRYYETK